MSSASVAVVDDDKIMCRYLADVRCERFAIDATFPNVESLLADGSHFDVVVLDMWIRPLINGKRPLRGVKAIRMVRKAATPEAPATKVVVHTAEDRPFVLAGLMLGGADALVSKAEEPEDLYATIDAVLDGGTRLPSALLGLIEVAHRNGKLPFLSTRHLGVLQLRARGMRSASIASELLLGTKTVDRYVAEIRDEFVELLSKVDVAGLEADDSYSIAQIARALGHGSGDLLDGF